VAGLLNSSDPKYSQDGGHTWEWLKTQPWGNGAAHIVAVVPRPNLVPRVVVGIFGDRPTLYRTGDFGGYWTKITGGWEDEDCSFFDESLEANRFITSPADPSRLYFMYSCLEFSGDWDLVSHVYTSADAGVSWTHIYDASFPDPTVSPILPKRIYSNINYGWSISDDAGLTWRLVGQGVQPGKVTLDGKNPDYLYDSYGLRSTDGGQTWREWTEKPCYYNGNRLTADLSVSELLYYPCPSGLYRSWDGGDHWEHVSEWVGKNMFQDFGNPSRLLWSRDDGIFASLDHGGTWEWLSDDYSESRFTPWINIDTPDEVVIHAVASQSKVNIWAFGDAGFIAKRRGGNWERVSSPVTTTLYAAQFITSDIGLAVGDQAILRWDGQTWTVAKEVSARLNDLDIVSTTDAWAVGVGGKIFHWDGIEWKDFASPTTVDLQSIDMLSATEGWAAGGKVLDDMMGLYPGVILHFNNGSWTIFKSTNYRFSDLLMVSPTEGWAVAFYDWVSHDNIVLHWDGADWQEIEIPANPLRLGLRSLYFSSPQDGWAVGDKILMHWNGTQWANANTSNIPYLIQLFEQSPGQACFLIHTDLENMGTVLPGYGPSVILCDQDFEKIFVAFAAKAQ
jgi:hypothetical protein